MKSFANTLSQYAGSFGLIPDGSTVILPGDHAIVVTAAGRLDKMDDIVEGGK